MVLLKPLSRAVADGDCIQGVLLGGALGHGGQSAGLTVPNPIAQAEVVRRALSDAETGSDAVQYIEAHGTGTPLGDPIEIQGLTQAFGNGARQRCAIGSVKTHIGHLEAAAGVAGLLKVLLALREKQIPPDLHLVEPNPALALDESP